MAPHSTIRDFHMKSRFSSHPVSAAVVLAALALTTTGCSEPEVAPANPKKVFPVTGTVLIDGAPAKNVHVKLYPKAGIDKENPTASRGVTDENGKFAVTTYYQGDGAPVGEYIVTFEHLVRSNLKPVPDELKGKYANALNNASVPEFNITVTEDEKGVDMGTIELSTQ